MKSDIKPEDKQIEKALLKVMSSRKNYETYIDHLDLNRLLPNTSVLLKDYGRYYKSFKHDVIDWPTFVTEFGQNWHSRDMDEDDVSMYRDSIIPTIQEVDATDADTAMESLLKRAYRQKLESKLPDFSEDEIQEVLDAFRKERQKYRTDIDEEAFSIDMIDFSVLDKDKGIPWVLPSIQRGLGSLVQGQFVVVAADYGVGKSAFVLSQATEAFKHLHRTKQHKPILYFNSEGTQADVYVRFLSCLYSKFVDGGFEEILTRIDEVKEKFCKTFNPNNFLVFQIQQGDMSKIKQKIDMYKPSLVIIDIADVLAKEEDVQHLKKLFDGLRLISATSCPIIATTQSGDTSYKYFDKEQNKMITKHRRWLNEKDLYGSKAGKGGAADTIITIGKDDDMPGARYVRTPKIKRGTVVSATCELIEKFSLYKELV